MNCSWWKIASDVLVLVGLGYSIILNLEADIPLKESLQLDFWLLVTFKLEEYPGSK